MKQMKWIRNTVHQYISNSSVRTWGLTGFLLPIDYRWPFCDTLALWKKTLPEVQLGMTLTGLGRYVSLFYREDYCI